MITTTTINSMSVKPCFFMIFSLLKFASFLGKLPFQPLIYKFLSQKSRDLSKKCHFFVITLFLLEILQKSALFKGSPIKGCSYYIFIKRKTNKKFTKKHIFLFQNRIEPTVFLIRQKIFRKKRGFTFLIILLWPLLQR